MSELVARGLQIRAGEHAIVHELDLELRSGRRVALLGPSGCGKSTLALALVGLRPCRGSLRFEGAELCGAPSSAWAKLRRAVHLCWQDARQALDPHMNVASLLNEARTLSGRGSLGDAERGALLERVGLEKSCAERRPVELSGGQRRRVGLARALAAEPEILIADEVTAGVDRPLARELVRLCESSAPGLLWIGHDLGLLPAELDEVVVLDAGRVVERGSVDAVLHDPSHAVSRELLRAAQARRLA